MKIFNFFHFKFQQQKISTFFISILVTYLKNFHFPLMVWPKFFKFEFTNQNRIFFQFSPFPSGGITKILKFKNKNFQFKFQKQKNKFCHFKFSLWHKQFFSRPEVAKFVKRLQKIHIYLYQK
jgi:hypothetical protein